MRALSPVMVAPLVGSLSHHGGCFMTGSPESGLTSEQLEFLALAREHQHLYLEFEGDASKAARLVYETAIDADEPAGGTSIVAVGHEVRGSAWSCCRAC